MAFTDAERKELDDRMVKENLAEFEANCAEIRALIHDKKYIGHKVRRSRGLRGQLIGFEIELSSGARLQLT